MKHGFVSVASAAPRLRLADCRYNAEQTFLTMRAADERGVKVLVLPELGLTGATCGDLFYQDTLLRGAEQALNTVLEATRNLEVVTALGMPLKFNNKLYNCAVIIQKGMVLGVVPKTYLDNHGESCEKRWFAPAPAESDTVTLFGQTVPFGTDLVFRCSRDPGVSGDFWGSQEVCQGPFRPSGRNRGPQVAKEPEFQLQHQFFQ